MLMCKKIITCPSICAPYLPVVFPPLAIVVLLIEPQDILSDLFSRRDYGDGSEICSWIVHSRVKTMRVWIKIIKRHEEDKEVRELHKSELGFSFRFNVFPGEEAMSRLMSDDGTGELIGGR